MLRDPATAFGPIARVLRSADLTVLNLETAVTRRGTPQPKRYHFRASARAFTALADSGVDVANMANNHVLDYGRVGLADTLAAARMAHFPVLSTATGVLLLTLRPHKPLTWRFVPTTVSRTGQPVADRGAAARRARARYRALRVCTGLSARPGA
ncbi:MAG: CapA family protein [Streptosporangiaceae bacterium]